MFHRGGLLFAAAPVAGAEFGRVCGWRESVGVETEEEAQATAQVPLSSFTLRELRTA